MKQRVIWAVLYEFGGDHYVLAEFTRKRARERRDGLIASVLQCYRNVRVVRFQASPGQGLRAYK